MEETQVPKKRVRQAVVALCWDPFTGEKFELKHTPASGMYIARTKRFMFGPFGSEGELLVALSTRDGVAPAFTAKQAEKTTKLWLPPEAVKRPPASRPRTQCPWTGKPVRIELADASKPEGSWVIEGEHYLIGGFQTERQAQHFFSIRDGVFPTFSPFDVEVINREKPESASEAEFDGMDQLRENAEKLKAAGIAK